MESTSADRQVRPRPGQAARCRTGKKGKATQQSVGDGRAAFLKSCFTPVAAVPDALSPARRTERQFFRSVQHFTALYGLPVPDVSGYMFPANIRECFMQLSEAFCKHETKLELVIVKNKAQKVCLATVKRLHIGSYCLYYLPVEPLVQLIRAKKRRQASLLLSVFAYLYRVLDIPFYTDNSYIAGCYESIGNFIEEAKEDYDEENHYTALMTEISLATYWGNKIRKMLMHPYTLQQLATRARQFSPGNKKDKELQEIAGSAAALFQAYPSRSILGEMPRRFLHPQQRDDEDDHIIAAEQLLSFIWSDIGIHSNYLMDHINCDLQEMTDNDWPIACQCFDKLQKKERHDLSFSEKVFELLNKICDYLY